MDIRTTEQLQQGKCLPCEGGVEPCSLPAAQKQLEALSGWELTDDGTMIAKEWTFKNFVQALGVLNEVARIAEEDQHHPDLHLTGYRNLKIELTTHAIKGLSENDFILAAKADAAASAVVS